MTHNLDKRPVAATDVAADRGATTAVDQLRQLALHPILPDIRRTTAMRDRLLARARASRARARGLINVRRDGGEWRFVVDGVWMKLLNDGATGKSVLIELAAGASLPTHHHREHEECVVLRGAVRLGDLEVAEGDYHLAPAGSRHGRVSSTGGALLCLRGAQLGDAAAVASELIAARLPRPGPAPVTLRAGDGWRDMRTGVQVKSLWSDGPEHSMLLRMRPGSTVPWSAHRLPAECLILTGEAFVDDTLLREGDYQFAPVGSQSGEIVSDVGALLFVHGDLIDGSPGQCSCSSNSAF